MQLYALDENNHLIFAMSALKQQNYRCIECQDAVRLRGGLHRQKHFYHVNPNRPCQLSGKGIVHLGIQLFFYQELPKGECQLEYRFPSIQRIADVAWMPHKIIFEIQCSPISAEEVERRNRDYQSLGWHPVWILHDQRYNQWRLTAAESILRSSNYYFADFNKEGKGIIYDQFDHFDKGLRKHRLATLPIDVKEFKCLQALPKKRDGYDLALVNQRKQQWLLSFKGDLVDLSLRSSGYETYLQEAAEIGKGLKPNFSGQSGQLEWFKKKVYRWVIRPYHLFFQILLERACR